MSIDQMNIVDYMTMKEKFNTLYLFITDHLPWDEDFEDLHLQLLQDKINVYLDFIEGNDYLERIPTIKPEAFAIEIKFKNPPTKKCIRMLVELKHQIKDWRKAYAVDNDIFIIMCPPFNDAGPCKTRYVIEFYQENDVNHLLDWDDLITFDLEDYMDQQISNSDNQKLPN